MESALYNSARAYLPDTTLPPEVESILPADPQSQLELAHKISWFAYAHKVSHLEAELQQLRDTLLQKQNTVKTMERRMSNLELEVQELQTKNKQGLEAQHKWEVEKHTLVDTVKKLNREVGRLQGFKRSLLQHLQEDDEVTALEASMSSPMDLATERMVADVLSSVGAGPPGTTPQRGMPPPSAAPPYHTPMPAASSQPSPPRMYHSATTAASPAGLMAGLGPGSPGRAEPGRVDGKEFFRHARQRLSTDSFSQFLQTIKDLNSGKQNRDATLRRAREIFGAQGDLYSSFEGLLSRHVTPL